ncbi:MAG: heavy metal translocating P-type ATPase, partial [Balneolaceae bacterium]
MDHQHHNHDQDHEMEHNHGHSSHKSHDHHDHHRMMMEDFKFRFWWVLALTIPILVLSPMIQEFMGVDWRFTGDTWILAALSTVVFFFGGWPF